MEELAIVTGGGSGIGRAIALALASRGLQVLVVGRREQPLRETCEQDPERLQALSADVSTAQGREALIAAVPSGARVRALVHNAALLEPVGPLAEVEAEAWRRHYAVNVEAPLFLSQGLLGQLEGGRVLHVSSGAAHHGYPGWGAYCSSKAALHMLYQVWSEEVPPRQVAFGSLRPGVVDTPMQAHIRQIPEERFPNVERFRRLKHEGQLRQPEEVGGFAGWLLLDLAAEDYCRHEWDLGDPAHYARWRR